MTSRESGHAVLELVMASVIMAILVLLFMPSASGYQTNALVRASAAQAVSQLREAQELAIGENSQIRVSFSPSDMGRATQGWQVARQQGSTLFTYAVPPQVNYTSACYFGWFSAQGVWSWPQRCGTPPATVEQLCFDNGTPGNPLALEVMIVVATGEVTVQQKPAGACP